jgi:hypothetical protein
MEMENKASISDQLVSDVVGFHGKLGTDTGQLTSFYDFKSSKLDMTIKSLICSK